MKKMIFDVLRLDIFGGEAAEAPTDAGTLTTRAEGQTGEEMRDAADMGENQTAAGAEGEQGEKEPTFDELVKGKYKESYQKAVQKIINGKFRESKANKARLDKAMPIFDVLANKFGISDPGNIDAVIDEIARKIQNDASIYEREALDSGVTPEKYAENQQKELENMRLRREIESLKQLENERRDAETIENWQRQAKELSNIYPDFDLQTEIENKDFFDLLGLNYDVRTAYEIIHRDELAQGAIKQAVLQTQKKTVDNIIARGTRPRENGLSTNGAADIKKKTVSEMSNKEILELAERAMRGEKINL